MAIKCVTCLASLPMQSGLACIRERLLQETVERYGVSKEFVKAEADTMSEVLAEINRR